MTKVGIKFCKNCGCKTKQTYMGKEPRTKEDIQFVRLATIATLGGFLIAEKLQEDRPSMWQCNNCNCISKY